MAAEGGHRSRNRAEIARIGHAIQRDDERLLPCLPCRLHEVSRVGIGVALDAQHQALMDGAPGEAVQLSAARLDDGDAGVRSQHHGLPDALVAVQPGSDVERRGWDAGAKSL